MKPPGFVCAHRKHADAGFALCIWGDPITGKYLSDPALDDIDDLNEYIDLLRHLSDSQDCYYLIAEDKTTHQPVGTCWRRHQRGRRVLGYWLLHPSHLLAAGLCQWKGESALLNFGVQNGAKKFLADVAAENIGSCCVLFSLGFTPTENGTFHRGNSPTEYKNLTFKKEL